MTDNPILVTGAAGFIDFHVAERLLSTGSKVVGVDSVNDYYDPNLKQARLDVLKRQSGFTFVKLDLADREETKSLFAQHRRLPSRISHRHLPRTTRPCATLLPASVLQGSNIGCANCMLNRLVRAWLALQ